MELDCKSVWLTVHLLWLHMLLCLIYFCYASKSFNSSWQYKEIEESSVIPQLKFLPPVPDLPRADLWKPLLQMVTIIITTQTWSRWGKPTSNFYYIISSDTELQLFLKQWKNKTWFDFYLTKVKMMCSNTILLRNRLISTKKNKLQFSAFASRSNPKYPSYSQLNLTSDKYRVGEIII